jgi:hypothetical protein
MRLVYRHREGPEAFMIIDRETDGACRRAYWNGVPLPFMNPTSKP